MSDEHFTRYRGRLSRRKLDALTPANATAARAVLLGMVEQAMARLRILEAGHQQVAGVVDELQSDVLGHDDSKGGEQLRRHLGNCNRMLHRNLEAIEKRRRDEAKRPPGGEEEKKRDGEEKKRDDEDLMIVDERGRTRPANTYEGDIEEGVARYWAKKRAAESGETIDSPQRIAEKEIPRVTDFARWKPPAVGGEGLRGAEEVGRDVQAARVEQAGGLVCETDGLEPELEPGRRGVSEDVVQNEAGAFVQNEAIPQSATR